MDEFAIRIQSHPSERHRLTFKNQGTLQARESNKRTGPTRFVSQRWAKTPTEVERVAWAGPGSVPVLLDLPGIIKAEAGTLQVAVAMPPLAPVRLPPELHGHVQRLGHAGRVVVERLALAAVLAELPCVPVTVAVLVVWCARPIP